MHLLFISPSEMFLKVRHQISFVQPLSLMLNIVLFGQINTSWRLNKLVRGWKAEKILASGFCLNLKSGCLGWCLWIDVKPSLSADMDFRLPQRDYLCQGHWVSQGQHPVWISLMTTTLWDYRVSGLAQLWRRRLWHRLALTSNELVAWCCKKSRAQAKATNTLWFES